MKYARLGEQAAKAIGAMKQIFYVYSTMARLRPVCTITKRPTTFSTKPPTLKIHCLTGKKMINWPNYKQSLKPKRKKENLLLKAQNETANANLQRNQVFLIAAIICIMLLGAFLYMIYQNKQGKERHIKTLEDFNTRLQEQADEIGRE